MPDKTSVALTRQQNLLLYVSSYAIFFPLFKMWGYKEKHTLFILLFFNTHKHMLFFAAPCLVCLLIQSILSQVVILSGSCSCNVIYNNEFTVVRKKL